MKDFSSSKRTKQSANNLQFRAPTLTSNTLTRLLLANSSLAANGLPFELGLPTVDSSQDSADFPSVPRHALADCFKNVIRSFFFVYVQKQQQGLRRQILTRI